MKCAILGPEELFPPGAVRPPWPGRHVRVDGLLSYVRETPATRADAEPALYVHGLGGSSQNWTDLAGLLADRVDGHAIDLPGFGRSQPGRSYSLPAFVEHVVRYLEQTDRGPVHLFGNSLGGAIVVRVAGLRPDLVRTLTLISPAMPFLDPRRSLQGRMLPLLAIPGARRITARYLTQLAPEEMARKIMESCVADTNRIPDSRLLMLDGVGHVAQLEVPQTVARATIGMLDEIVMAPGPEQRNGAGA